MGKFSFGKKGGDGDEDSNRSSLFGSRSSKSGSKTAASSNPYAQPQSTPDPYTQKTNPYGGVTKGPSDQGPPSAQGAPPPPYVAKSDSYSSNAGGYGSGRPAESRYGGNRYGGGGSGAYGQESQYGGAAAAGGADGGGYGGLGRTRSSDTNEPDSNRDALFGGAQDRQQQQQQQQQQLPPPNGQPGGGYGASDGYGGQSGGEAGYGAYGENRQLTAEEEEEQDVQAAKQQIRLMKQQDVASTRNALRVAAQAEETGRDTLERLAAQGERIHNTEKNLDLATNQNRIAEERAKELKTLNKSMFAVHVSNPFTKASRRQQRDDDVINKHRTERDQRDQTRASAFASKTRVEGAFHDLRPGDPGYDANRQKSRLAERARYQFEADSEDDDMEDQIDRNLDSLGNVAGRLNALARATGREVDEQNKHIDVIISKSDRVDDQITMNRARLDRIH
ncbi:MAG: Protein transport protein S9 plasma membrane t-SNARE [Lichina confinis]|nr:MAG: Protein transport protein S9 plasma membrane t-SNARE [Lichina confinis]